MIRPILVLVSAIQLSRPGMPADEAKQYSKVLNEVAASKNFDPLIAVAIIHHETQWRPSLVSADGEDYGLGQVRARFLEACQGDEDPVHAPSDTCRQAKESLLDASTNLRRMGSVIGANMEFCKKHTGSSKTERWLSGYQGYWDPDHGRYCVPGEKTFQVMAYYRELIEKFAPPPKPKKTPLKVKAKTGGASDKPSRKKQDKPVVKKAVPKRASRVEGKPIAKRGR